ncbi:uncharacterized protein [Montipora capricornis]|uniref:uncharacterized protein n=1 Tax=Montipora capricornis TaxID=246305 RepID=UPI0035F10231
MANLRTSFSCVYSLRVVTILMGCLAVQIEALELDLNLTRKEVITFLGQTANLACYATNTNSPLTYSWTKANQTVTQSSYIRAVGHVLVVTPMEEKHFGNYMCNISDGASSATCLISLSKGINETEYVKNTQGEPSTGCVNISVLMPVLAVAVMSLLLFIHLLIRGKRTEDKMRDKKIKHSEECSSRHSEASTSVIEEPIEMQVNGHLSARISRSPEYASNRYLSHSPGFQHSSRALVSENASQSPVFTRMSRFHVNGEESNNNRLSSPRSDHEQSSPKQAHDAQNTDVTPF